MTTMKQHQDKTFKILHSIIDCPRVELRLPCDDCGYPASEAQFNDESELLKFLNEADENILFNLTEHPDKLNL